MQDPQEQLFNFQKDNIFPSEFLPGNFRELALIALRHHSLSQLQMSIDEYRALVNTKEYSLRDISLLLNSMHAKTPEHMGFDDLLDYANFQEMVGILSEKWKDIVTPERDRLKAEMEAREQISNNFNKKLGKKGLKIPLGQA